MHQYQDLITLFNHCFLERNNTQLVEGKNEPLYLPANEKQLHNTIYFTHDYFASALHECAHWLIAGQKRRKSVDFGYWYEPDGRTAEQQKLFLSVEVKPQAMEWILSEAANFRFQVSFDNLNGVHLNNNEAFKQAIFQQVKIYCEKGLPKRAKIFRHVLCQFYDTPLSLEFKSFDFSIL